MNIFTTKTMLSNTTYTRFLERNTSHHGRPLICSFYTTDAYYTGHAKRLEAQLAAIGADAVLSPIEKKPDQDWADICRRKVGFLASVCAAHPDRRVFWIDVDCQLVALPDYVNNFSADIIGFQRGFSDPLKIGYANRTRFWEPCFWGIGPTAGARAFLAEAVRLEQSNNERATDDYFFEEAWRAHASTLSFQIIPSIERIRGDIEHAAGFFVFGSSGQVPSFKDKVVQHRAPGIVVDAAQAPTLRRWGEYGRNTLLRLHSAGNLLPSPIRPMLRRVSHKLGLVERLSQPVASKPIGPVQRFTMLGKKGQADHLNGEIERLGGLNALQGATKARALQALAFADYREGKNPVRLSWWANPAPGNYGDWLAPYLAKSISGRPIAHANPMKPGGSHIAALGSIGRFVTPTSIVCGVGVSRQDTDINPRAHYISVRGPLTAALLREQGGPAVERFGDPGLALSRLYPAQRKAGNGRVALLRHYIHRDIPLRLPAHVDEVDVLVSRPSDIEALIERLVQYDFVLTSAMHGMITCHSYGIACGLISFGSEGPQVHGDGIKYRDYFLGAGLKERMPTVVGLDLRRRVLSNLVTDDVVSPLIVDDIMDQLSKALLCYEAAEASRKMSKATA